MQSYFFSKVLNSFIVLLLSSFGTEKLKENKQEVTKIQEAVNRITRFFKYLVKKCCCKKSQKKQQDIQLDSNDRDETIGKCIFYKIAKHRKILAIM